MFYHKYSEKLICMSKNLNCVLDSVHLAESYKRDKSKVPLSLRSQYIFKIEYSNFISRDIYDYLIDILPAIYSVM